MSQVAKFHSMIIILTRQQTKAGLQYKQYLELTHGRIRPNQMIAPLAIVSFFEYYQYLSSLFKTCSIQNKKAGTVLTFLCIIECKYNGDLPGNVE